MRKLSINIITSIVAQIVAAVCGFILPRLILEFYGSEVNGLTQSVKQFLGIINFLELGLGQVVCSSLYQPLHDHDYAQVSRILSSGKKFYRSIAIVLVGYVFFLTILYPYFVKDLFTWSYTALLIGIMAISSFAQYYFGVTNELLLHADQKNYLSYLILIFSNILNVLVCVWLINRGCSIHVLKIATSFVFLVKPIVYALYIHKQYEIDWKIEYDEEPIKQKWNGIAQHVSAVVLDGTDNIVLTIFSNLSNVSIYSVYYFVISTIQSLYAATVTGIQSAVGAIWASRDKSEISSVFYTVEFFLHSLTLFLFTCTGKLIVPFVQVYTVGLTDANYVQPVFSLILVFAYFVRSLRTPYNVWILAAGHFKQTQKCHIISATINLFLSVLFVWKWGLIGVALGSFFAMCYQTVWMAKYTVDKLIQIPYAHLLKRFLVDVLAVIVVSVFTKSIYCVEVTYMSWFLMAVKVSVISFICILLISLVFYRIMLIKLVKLLKNRISKFDLLIHLLLKC